jgi:hypothetical protein
MEAARAEIMRVQRHGQPTRRKGGERGTGGNVERNHPARFRKGHAHGS